MKWWPVAVPGQTARSAAYPSAADCRTYPQIGRVHPLSHVLVPRLSELAILVVARHWDCQFEWSIHAPIALKSGLGAATVEAIANRRRPTGLRDDEGIVYDYATELLQRHQVADELYATATRLFWHGWHRRAHIAARLLQHACPVIEFAPGVHAGGSAERAAAAAEDLGQVFARNDSR